MKLFRRSKPVQPNVPPEVAEYYQAERRERRGVAWLMTLFTLLVTVAVVLGLFIAGRWLYHTVQNRNKKPTVTATQSKDTTKKTADNDSDSATNDTAPASGTPDASTPDEPSSGDTTPTPATPTPAPATPSTPSTPAPSTGATQPLTNTGPGDTAAVLFIGAALIGYSSYRYKLQAHSRR